MERTGFRNILIGGIIAVLGLAVFSCGTSSESANLNSATQYPLAGTCSGLSSCANLTGTPWVPNVSSASAGNHDGSVSVTQTQVTVAGSALVGLSQAAPSSKEVTVTIDMTQDLGPYGSLTLEASVKNFPKQLYGNAYPILVYLSDGTNELINLTRTSANGCQATGYYTCSNGTCTANSNCSVQWPSAFNDRAHWEQHQVTLPSSSSDAYQSYPSVNTFPTCNWTGGNAPADTSDPACAFNTTFFPTGVGYATPRLRYGVTYTAKYVLLANSYSSLTGYTADLSVNVIKKTDAAAGGAIDLNVILVGTKNVQDSRTDQGKRNLDTLFTSIYDYYNQSGTGIQLGTINAVEWPCDQCGDYYAQMPMSDLQAMYRNVAPILPGGTDGKALNLFMVSTIPGTNTSEGGYTILGVAGAIGGSASNGTPISGVSFSSFNQLGTYNSTLCTSANPCPLTQQESSFVEFGQTIAHEMGHYLGLNHPNERDASWADTIDDTPLCTSKSGSGALTIGSCLTDTNVFPSTSKSCSQVCGGYSPLSATFCPTKAECQFNHIMWWTNKNFDTASGQGDGALFSPHTGGIMNYSPFIQ